MRAVEVLDEQALACDVLVLAVKPQQLKVAVEPLKGRLSSQVVVSIAAGLRLADIGRWLGDYRKLVRAMPNTPALIGAGITGLFADASVDAEGRAAAEEVLSAVGSTVWVPDEAQIVCYRDFRQWSGLCFSLHRMPAGLGRSSWF